MRAIAMISLSVAIAGCVVRTTDMTKELRDAMTIAPHDRGLLCLEAGDRAQRGDRAGALVALAALDRLGWDFPLDERDFPGLLADPTYVQISARIAAREPRVLRGHVAAVIEEADLIPDGIAVDSRDGSVYVGSIWKRKIVRVRSNEATDFASEDLLEVLGLHLDIARDTLWAASNAAGRGRVSAFDLRTGRERFHVDAPLEGRHLFNDLTVAEDGTAYVTDSRAGGIWRLRPGATALEVFLPSGSFHFPNGIVSDGKDFLVAHEFGIARVTAAGARTPLEHSADVTLAGIDGLDREGDVLLAVQNAIGTARIMRFDLDAAHRRVVRATTLESGNPLFRHPTTAVIDAVKRQAMLIADSYVDTWNGKSLTTAERPSTTVLAIPLDD